MKVKNKFWVRRRHSFCLATVMFRGTPLWNIIRIRLFCVILGAPPDETSACIQCRARYKLGSSVCKVNFIQNGCRRSFNWPSILFVFYLVSNWGLSKRKLQQRQRIIKCITYPEKNNDIFLIVSQIKVSRVLAWIGDSRLKMGTNLKSHRQSKYVVQFNNLIIW